MRKLHLPPVDSEQQQENNREKEIKTNRRVKMKPKLKEGRKTMINMSVVLMWSPGRKEMYQLTHKAIKYDGNKSFH